jgi:hypothetical protein
MSRLDPESKAALDLWADQIVGLEPGIPAAVARFSQQIADNRKVPKSDRQFAQAQVEAIRRAVRRRRRKAKSTS